MPRFSLRRSLGWWAGGRVAKGLATAAVASPDLNTGPLVDGDLELVAPDERWVDAVLAACRHRQTRAEEPLSADVTRGQLEDFLRACPGGRARPGNAAGLVPGYHFWMRAASSASLPIVGEVGLRLGDSDDLRLYYGHVGYHVYPFARGQRYAGRAVSLLAGFARRHGIDPMWVTCNPDNFASRRTCERLGATLVETVRVPAGHPLRRTGETEKCRYRLALAAPELAGARDDRDGGLAGARKRIEIPCGGREA